jgi:hypothetical protein
MSHTTLYSYYLAVCQALLALDEDAEISPKEYEVIASAYYLDAPVMDATNIIRLRRLVMQAIAKADDAYNAMLKSYKPVVNHDRT